MSDTTTDELWRLPRVIATTGISRSRIYALIKRGDVFPKPVRIPGTRCVAWRSDEIEEFINRSARVDRA